ncbi:helix-turn-helix transcriptional regulator [Streptomyces sp. NPDC004542]|uniref:helix-turn-helix domain-containing protein n=1 Tax=Streptomyces sp. NPDC004542 TaxID=3154281 RepID=UPI00339F5A30
MDRPPFHPATSVSARQHLGLSPLDVAQQMTLVVGARVDPDTVLAWESGTHRPTESELFALADVLWCRTTELMGIKEPRNLAEHRLARQFSVNRLTRSIGMEPAEYMRAEEQNRWTGNFHQTLSLLHALNISFRQLEDAAGPCGLPGPDPAPDTVADRPVR